MGTLTVNATNGATVAKGATYMVPLPSGKSLGNYQTAGATITTSDGSVYPVTVSFGASGITVTNPTGRDIASGGFDFIDLQTSGILARFNAAGETEVLIGTKNTEAGLVSSTTDPLTGVVELSAAGKSVEYFRAPQNYISTPSDLLYDMYESAATFGVTTLTLVRDPSIKRFGNGTLKCTPSGSSAQLRLNNTSLIVDPVNKLLSVDVYIPAVVTGNQAISIVLFNTNNYTGDSTTWGWNLNALRQGWNTLKMWFDDTNATATVPPTGKLGYGCSKSIAGAGVLASAAIQSWNINIQNATGVDFYFDGFRKGCIAKPVLVMGFDATGKTETDEIFVKSGGVAEYFQGLGIKAYFTSTYYWDIILSTLRDNVRKDILYNDFGWDCLPHFWNHGASYPGGDFAVTSLSRTTNVVTCTTTAPLPADLVVGRKIYSMVSGATPSDFNGLAYMTVTGASTLTYASTGSNGSATGTLTFSTKPEDVINADDATRRQILRHELVDLVRVLRARGWTRGLHIGAYPVNSVPVMEVAQPICAEAGIKYFRGIKKTSSAVTEFGVDNPLNFGSVEMGSDATSPTLQNVKDALAGAIGRGEHLWTYGHYILDETDPANIAHVSADLNYAPGRGGNPAPPVSAGGWWYFGTLKKFMNETVLPLVASGQLQVLSPSQWASGLGNIDGSH